MKDLRRTVFHGVAALRGAYFNQTSIRSGRIASVTDPVRRGRVAWRVAIYTLNSDANAF